jgi:hypothetical protein
LINLVAFDIKFMISYDCEWNFQDYAVGSPGPAGPSGPLIPPAAGGDDVSAPAPALTSAAIDPHDFTKWDLADLPSIPLGEQQLMKPTVPSVVLGMLHSFWSSCRMTSTASIQTLPGPCMRDTRASFYGPSRWLI